METAAVENVHLNLYVGLLNERGFRGIEHTLLFTRHLSPVEYWLESQTIANPFKPYLDYSQPGLHILNGSSVESVRVLEESDKQICMYFFTKKNDYTDLKEKMLMTMLKVLHDRNNNVNEMLKHLNKSLHQIPQSNG
jgi:hypothetical protein